VQTHHTQTPCQLM